MLGLLVLFFHVAWVRKFREVIMIRELMLIHFESFFTKLFQGTELSSVMVTEWGRTCIAMEGRKQPSIAKHVLLSVKELGNVGQNQKKHGSVQT
jgi:hypothetical protein